MSMLHVTGLIALAHHLAARQSKYASMLQNEEVQIAKTGSMVGG